MNRHRANWSAMHDAGQEESQISKDFNEFRKQVRIFAGKYSLTDATSIIRSIVKEIYEEEL